jgi:hypothetical protein
MPKIATNDIVIRKECTSALFELLKKNDNTVLEFKLDIIKELSKVIKSKPHSKMEPNILDCLLYHDIVVDEEKAKLVD